MNTLTAPSPDFLWLRARRHSRYVYVLRRLFPFLTLILVAWFIGRLLFGFVLLNPLPTGGDVFIESGKLVMSSPHLSGYSGNDSSRSYDIRASRAIEETSNPGFVTLESIDARFDGTSWGTINLTTPTGILDVLGDRLELPTSIFVTGENDLSMTLTSASIDYNLGYLFSPSPVSITFGGTTLTAGSLMTTNNGSSLKFGDGVHTTLTRSVLGDLR